MRKKVERTAYHEAGHVVASYHLRIAFASITIIPEGDSLGHLSHPKGMLKNFKPDQDDSLKTKDRAERMIIVFLAGQASEWRFANRHNWRGAEEDWHQAVDFASYIAGGGEVLNKYMEYLWARAKALFGLPGLWAAVEAVANELLTRKKMGRRLTRKVIRKAINDCREREDT